ncbi:MAG: hypothetical protein Kow0092_00770 [Deferrisomatales bacterium]
MIPSLRPFFRFFFHRQTVRRSVRVALVVGPILVTINQFELLQGAAVSGTSLVKMALTFCVPFCVSGYSSARTMLIEARRSEGGGPMSRQGRPADSR